MEGEGTITAPANQCKDWRTRCPFCLATIDVNLDKRSRPYWVCVACQTRTFATRTTLDNLETVGWIWSEEPPLEVLQAWLKRVAEKAGLTRKERK